MHVAAHIFQDSDSERPAKVVSKSRKHSTYIHFPKHRNCKVCKRTEMTRAPCRKRIGGAVPRAENFGDLITADRKVLGEGSESRNNHRCPAVVQDLATQWLRISLYTECLCLLRWMQQFILAKITCNFFILPKIKAQRTTRQLFDVSRMLITDQTVIQGVAREMGSPRHAPQQAAADSRVSRTCVCAKVFVLGATHAWEEGRINVLPWCRPVGVAKTSSRRKEEGTWRPARVSGRHVVRG